MKKRISFLALFLFLSLSTAWAQTDSSYIHIAPNPTDDDVTIQVSAQQKTLKGIRVYDIIGKEITYIDLTGRNGFITLKVDLSLLPPGVYFCTLYSDKGIVESKKIIKKGS
ncbi:MAG: T9SS type A sorting domain-containing protein [Cytophagaceae bacterium]|jgi:hypothetical protein|nr:T9SS type A sorting domain-containing protein [Cytophagaceae bacterium]